MKQQTVRKTKKSKSFNPSRDEISSAMEEFLENGGKIEKMETFPEEEMDRILSHFVGVV